jgi:hypothetical protein
MQTALKLVAPYGTAFQTTMSPMPGAPMEVWLMHDTSKGGEVIEWLRTLLNQYEDQLQQLARAQVLAQQSAAQAQVVHNEQPAPVSIPAPVSVPVPAAPVAPAPAPAAHDWGGVYKLGKACAKCGTPATGFEGACKQQA